jgi:hypothetical protein
MLARPEIVAAKAELLASLLDAEPLGAAGGVA